MNSRHFEQIKTVFRGALVLALFWLTGFALVQFGQRVFGGWAVSQVGEVLACLLGVFLAFRMRVKFIAYVLAGQLAFSLSELALHSIYGNRSVQGGPTHFAVMLAGTLGVVLGWFLRSQSQTPTAQVQSASSSPSQPFAGELSPRSDLASGAA
jgi:hypothetical protein